MSKTFAFGKNWQAFVDRYLDEERIGEAKTSLSAFCEGFDFRGKSFVDAGCGSGLFSLAAHRLGAERIVSFDADPDAVRCCERLREREGNPPGWQVLKASILDPPALERLGKFDLVYSWGVLHHTGAMWQALENTLALAAPGGLAYLAIYNKADGFAFYPDGRFGPSAFWEKEKRIYSSLPAPIQNVIDYATMGMLAFLYLITFNNPAKKIRSHKALRGMSWRIDIKDWLGGYPYEYASPAEVFRFAKVRGFSLENLKCNNGLLNNEYLFRRNQDS